jgi:hypothetical protein
MSAPRLLAPTTISGGVPTAGAGTLNTIALWTTPDGNTLGNSLLTQSGNIVTNASGAIRAAGTTQTSPAFTRHDTTTSGIYFPATNEIGFTISSQHAMFISSGRYVGIGTTSPAGRLDVVGVAASLGWAIRAQVNSANTSPALNAELGLNLKNTSATVGNYTSITNRDSSDNANTQINFINVNNSGSGAINFVTRDSVGGSGERARIDSAGNFGIGVIPSAWASSVRAEEMRTHARWNYNSGSDSVAYWTVNAFLNSAGNAIYKASTAASQYSQNGGAHVWERAVSGTAGNTVTWLESARIDSSGNLILNTANTGATIQAAGSQQGLKLPATPGNADAQTLDCYQENPLATTAGNGWTPTIGGTAAQWGGTLPTVSFARYVQIGSIVFCDVRLTSASIQSTYGVTTITPPPPAQNAFATEVVVPASTTSGGVTGNGAQFGGVVYLPTLAASTAIRLTWFYFTTS